MTDPIKPEENSQPKPQDPPQDNPPKETPPAQPNAGQGNQDSLPEKFKGKSAEDIARSYIELEKNLGQKSNDIQQREKELAQYKALAKVIADDPDLRAAVEKKVYGKTDDKPDDTRVAVENDIIAKFESKFGLDFIGAEKRKDLNGKIGRELLDMLDPGGTKTVAQVVKEIPLNRLPNYLEKAYKIVTSEDREERARAEAYIQARQNAEATFGSIPSGSVDPEKVQLTEAEKTAARKMGISEKEYLENKKAMMQ